MYTFQEYVNNCIQVFESQITFPNTCPNTFTSTTLVIVTRINRPQRSCSIPLRVAKAEVFGKVFANVFVKVSVPVFGNLLYSFTRNSKNRKDLKTNLNQTKTMHEDPEAGRSGRAAFRCASPKKRCSERFSQTCS